MTEEIVPEKLRVLIVEDEDSIRLSLREFFKRRNFVTYAASDGLSALKELLDVEIDIIISDYKMDVFGGDYWVRFLKKHYSDKLIILTSGFLKPSFPVPFPVVYKPYSYKDLYEMVAKELAA